MKKKTLSVKTGGKNPRANLAGFPCDYRIAAAAKLLLVGFGSSGFSFSFSSNLASRYRSGSDGQVVAVGDNGHASWQDQVADVQRVTDVDVRQVNV